MPPEDLQTLLSFFKALADASRLKILGILADREASVGELAAHLELREPTVSHHLARLKSLGLVRARAHGTTRLYALDTAALEQIARDVLSPDCLRTVTEREVDLFAWDRKVLATFLDEERLLSIPASRKKREVILRWLAERFDRGVRYSQRKVNDIIQRHHPDSATLRRELVGYNLLRRKDGRYWRP